MNHTIKYTLITFFLFNFTITSFASTLNINTKYDNYTAVACDRTATQCLAVGIDDRAKTHTRIVIQSHDAGKTWSNPASLPPLTQESPLTAISQVIACDNTGTVCIIASVAQINNRPVPIIYKTEDGGSSWTNPQRLSLPKSVHQSPKQPTDELYLSLSCNALNTHCKLSATYSAMNELIQILYRTTDAGKTWSRYKKSLPSNYWINDSDTLLRSITCGKTTKHCIIAGDTYKRSFGSETNDLIPLIYYSENDGASWSKPVLPKITNKSHQSGYLIKVSCDDTGLICTALGSIFTYDDDMHYITITTNNGGKTWHKKVHLDHSYNNISIYDLHCDASGKVCNAVGEELINNRGFLVYQPVVYTTSDVTASLWEKVENNYPLLSTLLSITCNETGSACVGVGYTIKSAENNNPPSTLLQSRRSTFLHPNHRVQSVSEVEGIIK